MNTLRNKLLNNEKIRGTLVCLTDPCLCEIIGNIGYDCVWIDMEHTYVTYKDVLCHLNAAKSSGISSVVRLPQNDLTATKKILEMSPDGIIFPMVKSANELKELIETTLYPPYGTRGFGPMRAIEYGAADVNEYVKSKSLELCRFVQIEDVGLIDDIEEILDYPYVDGFVFGPNDLSGSMKMFMDKYNDKMFSVMKNTTEKLKKAGKFVGLAGGISEEEIKFWAPLNLDMLFMGADWNFIYECGKKNLDLLNKYI